MCGGKRRRAERATALAHVGELSAAAKALTAPPLAPASQATLDLFGTRADDRKLNRSRSTEAILAQGFFETASFVMRRSLFRCIFGPYVQWCDARVLHARLRAAGSRLGLALAWRVSWLPLPPNCCRIGRPGGRSRCTERSLQPVARSELGRLAPCDSRHQAATLAEIASALASPSSPASRFRAAKARARGDAATTSPGPP